MFEEEKNVRVIMDKPIAEKIFLWIWRGLKIIFVFLLLGAIFGSSVPEEMGNSFVNREYMGTYPSENETSDPKKVALIPLFGPIMDMSQDSFGGGLGTAYAEDILYLLDEASFDDNVSAIVLQIDTPGGTVVASQKISDRIRSLQKPLFVLMESSATSGGYLVAANADKIYAYPQTITGNIGVRLDLPKVKELMDTIGVEMRSIKSGEFKDMGSPYRDMTEGEEDIFTEIMNEAYQMFLETVATGRDMDMETVIQLADGRIYTGNQAMKNGLIDQTVLGFGEAMDDVAKEIGAESIDLYSFSFFLSPWEEFMMQMESFSSPMFGGMTDPLKSQLMGPRLMAM